MAENDPAASGGVPALPVGWATAGTAARESIRMDIVLPEPGSPMHVGDAWVNPGPAEIPRRIPYSDCVTGLNLRKDITAEEQGGVFNFQGRCWVHRYDAMTVGTGFSCSMMFIQVRQLGSKYLFAMSSEFVPSATYGALVAIHNVKNWRFRLSKDQDAEVTPSRTKPDAEWRKGTGGYPADPSFVTGVHRRDGSVHGERDFNPPTREISRLHGQTYALAIFDFFGCFDSPGWATPSWDRCVCTLEGVLRVHEQKGGSVRVLLNTTSVPEISLADVEGNVEHDAGVQLRSRGAISTDLHTLGYINSLLACWERRGPILSAARMPPPPDARRHISTRELRESLDETEKLIRFQCIVKINCQAQAQAQARPGQALSAGSGSGFENLKPEPARARPKPGLSGQAGPWELTL
ncbi:hypothetical protein C8R43DRAFT_941245 [Mycena crocata]|nr:hypothetical protein C8R43DRAFT_941245 [Mycena crocata]